MPLAAGRSQPHEAGGVRSGSLQRGWKGSRFPCLHPLQLACRIQKKLGMRNDAPGCCSIPQTLHANQENLMSYRAGRHFLHIAGPTNVPDLVMRAIDFPTMDHRGPEFADLGKAVLDGMKRVFKTAGRGGVS